MSTTTDHLRAKQSDRRGWMRGARGVPEVGCLSQQRRRGCSYQRIRGELLHLGRWVSGSSIAGFCASGLQPAPSRAAGSRNSAVVPGSAGSRHRGLRLPHRGHRVPATAVGAGLHPTAPSARPPRRRHRQPTGAWVAQQAAASSPCRMRRPRSSGSCSVTETGSSPGPSTTSGVRWVQRSS
jgi:hypothetical protein